MTDRVLTTLFGLTPVPRKQLTRFTHNRPLHPPSADDHSVSTAPTQGNTVCLPPQPNPSQRHLLYQSYSLTTLLKLFQAHKPQFSGADQQDSQEFLCELLDTFHEDLKQVPAVVPSPAGAAVPGTTVTTAAPTTKMESTDGEGSASVSPTPAAEGGTEAASGGSAAKAAAAPRDSSTMSADPTMTVQQQGEARWTKYLEGNSSVVSHLFQGQTCSKIICKVCSTSSTTFEPFTTLSMPIPRSRSLSVSQSDSTTVVVTVLRKMPRLSQILRLPDEVFTNSVLTQGILYDLYK